MAYYLAVETNRDVYVGLNIKKSERYKKLFEYNGSSECSLEEIDKFTTKYSDESKLKYELYSDKILPRINCNSQLAIIYYDGIEARKVKGTILFENSRNLIENPNQVIDYINQKTNENDYIFYRELLSFLPETSVITQLISNHATSLEKRIVSETEVQDLSVNSMSENIAKLLIYYVDIKESGEISFFEKINAENLHNLVAFIQEYEEKLTREKSSGYSRTKTKNTSN